MTRLPQLRPADLDESQRAVYDSIVGGERARGVRHFPLAADDGSLYGPFGVMLHAPGVGGTLQELGAIIRFHTDLTARVREIAILQVARATGSDYEWWAHERVARANGLNDEELAQLSLGRFGGDDPIEQAAAEFVGSLLASNEVTNEDFAAARALLSAGQLIELTTLVGYYRTLAQLMSVFDIGVPDDSA